MRIIPQLAQPIVERAIAILHLNVNIMDATGTICGSGEPDRIGTFHEGAAQVARSGRPLEIGPEDAVRLSGVRPGVNLPIRLGDNVVGVVGITGLPQAVRHYGELICEMVQLMLDQARTAENALAAALAREAALRELLDGTEPLTDRLLREAYLLGLNERDAYQVLVCEPPWGSEAGRYERFEALAERAVTTLKAEGASPVLSVGPWDGRLALVAGRPAEGMEVKLARELGSGTPVAAGHRIQGIHSLRRSYRTALSALRVVKLLPYPAGLSAEALYLETLLSAVNPEDARVFVDRVTGGLPPANSGQGQMLRQSIEAYLHAGMSQTGGAEALGIHRHTLIYRLEQVAEATGLKPWTWDGALRLSLALLLERLFGQNVDL